MFALTSTLRTFEQVNHVCAGTLQPNIALHKTPVIRSVTNDASCDDRAVDGQRLPKQSDCMCTNIRENQPWLSVDLGAQYTITGIIVTNVRSSYGK